MFLGLDLSLSSTGVCVYLDATTADTFSIKPPPKTRGAARLHYIRREFVSILEQYGGPAMFRLACIEGYAYNIKSTGRTWQLAELGGVIRTELEASSIPFIVANIQHVKNFVGLDGHAEKAEVGFAVLERFARDFRRQVPEHPKKAGTTHPKVDLEAWGVLESHWRDDETDAFILACIGALYADTWDILPNEQQLDIIQMIKVDPQDLLSAAKRKARQAEMLVDVYARKGERDKAARRAKREAKNAAR